MRISTQPRKVYRRDAHEAVAARVEFDYNSSATGRWENGVIERGGLGPDSVKAINEHVKDAGRAFVVRSYRTPIAVWTEEKGWWTTDAYFSQTTRTHQGFVRRGIA